MVKKVIAINDLSGLGRCSLTAAIPVLSVLGVQPCPLPTAVLTNQTGFPSYYLDDYTDKIDFYRSEWRKLHLKPDGIFTGFLASERQVEKIAAVIEEFKTPQTLLVVDPVMADGGEIYPALTPALCEKMQRLAFAADVITPNLTEACLLAGTDYHTLISGEEAPNYLSRIYELGERLLTQGVKTAIITGVRHLCARDNTRYLYNVAISPAARFYAKSEIHGGGYSGTGDLFASVICGCLVQGIALESAVRRATHMIEAATADSFTEGADRNHGVNFEPYLPLLLQD